MLLPVAAHTNLIARSTIPQLWTRHVADSLQLLPLAPDAKMLDRPRLRRRLSRPGDRVRARRSARRAVHLVESIRKKAAFLREAAQQIQVPAMVHAVRIEDFGKNFDMQGRRRHRARARSARRTAASSRIRCLKTGAQGLFPKGQDVEGELTEASKYWNIEASLVPSKTNAASRIVVVKALAPRRKTVKSHVRSRR